jgi:hypothetical protein
MITRHSNESMLYESTGKYVGCGGQRLRPVIGRGARRSRSVDRADEEFGRPGLVSAGAAIFVDRRVPS